MKYYFVSYSLPKGDGNSCVAVPNKAHLNLEHISTDIAKSFDLKREHVVVLNFIQVSASFVKENFPDLL